MERNSIKVNDKLKHVGHAGGTRLVWDRPGRRKAALHEAAFFCNQHEGATALNDH
jgi:hypothetical protein